MINRTDTAAFPPSVLNDWLEGDDMKICEDCAYLTRIGLCTSPENGVSMVTGKPIPMFASERRSAGISVIFTGTEKCGPEAKHFAPKLPPKHHWWKFWDRTKPTPSNAAIKARP